MSLEKPTLSVSKILQMNIGFLGLQFSFGLQQANMSPIWAYLGAKEENFAWLGIAGPLTGLIVQPIIGAMSDRTLSKFGRRTPFFLIGAIMCSVGLFFMPLSQSVLMAFSILLLLDVGNNITMEPYRAYVNDRLNREQRGFGFLSQAAFTGLAQTLAFLMPSLLVWFGLSRAATSDNNIPEFTRISFLIGSFLSISTILWSILRVPELPLSNEEKARILSLPRDFKSYLSEIWSAILEMPVQMKTMALMSLFQWYAMCGYWGYTVNSISRSMFGTADAATQGYRDAVLTNGELGAVYNITAFVGALAMAPIARKFGAHRLHGLCLVSFSIGLFLLPSVHEKAFIFLPAILMGIGWGSIMGNPYIVLADSIPKERTGVYMGIFNMMICAPMIIFALSMRFMYQPLLGGDARNVLYLSSVLMIFAAISIFLVKDKATHPKENYSQ